MKTTLELPTDLVRDIERRASQEGRQIDEAAADLLRKGLAAPTAAGLADPAMLERRAQVTQKFLSGEWGVALDGFESARAADRAAAGKRDAAWRD